MHLGFCIPQMGKAVSPGAVRAVATRAEDVGYRTVWGLERILRPLEPQTPYARFPGGRFPDVYGTVYDPIGTLVWAAAFTKRVRLGISVMVLPLHAPIHAARRVATLDVLSGGRVVLGVGTGWSKDEYDAAGVAFERRAARMEEYLCALRALWGPDPVEFAGTFYSVPRSEVGPKPLQDPLPIAFATFNPLGFRMLARHCQGWNPQRLVPSQIREQGDRLRAAIRAEGRDPSVFEIAYRVNMPIQPGPVNGERMPFSGPIESFREDLAALAEAGVDEVHFDVQFLPDVTTTDDHLRYLELLRACWP